MREYYLFIIKENYYQSNTKDIFVTLKTLTNLKENYNLGISIYNQICKTFDISIITKYLNDKYCLNQDNTFYIDNVTIKVRPSCVIVQSPYNLPRLLRIFNYYNKHIFVCDFKNNDYFWLNDFIKGKVLEYV